MIDFTILKADIGSIRVNLANVNYIVEKETMIAVTFVYGPTIEVAKEPNESFLTFIDRRLRNVSGIRAEEGDV